MEKIITKRKNGSVRIQYRNIQPSKTDNSQAKACDVNEITNRYIKANGKRRFENYMHQQHSGTYSDIIQATSLMEAFEIVQTAQEMFDHLPATARDKFKNDPLHLEQWLQDPANAEEAISMGLMKAPEPTPEPSKGKSKKSAAGTPPAAEPNE